MTVVENTAPQLCIVATLLACTSSNLAHVLQGACSPPTVASHGGKRRDSPQKL